eukprot:CAMPEP_0202965484 /NCGR_PEP_ID=MMETSP1396-20130829/9446_1 /ASSEMBLY_ACC=CAM_ASM_000872 /TAXON_ID= /ORGANISM="Pseudokeronopsis sp., Strain Brazil" /LENGTH=59 /DNA_ID=CAMNT_0049688213 /DNA_START=318 /DNA_END=497 /DNA_ORIENTATION=+
MDDVASPMDAAISKKKKELRKLDTKFSKEKSNGGGGNFSMQNCDDGMSPQLNKFPKRKQ